MNEMFRTNVCRTKYKFQVASNIRLEENQNSTRGVNKLKQNLVYDVLWMKYMYVVVWRVQLSFVPW